MQPEKDILKTTTKNTRLMKYDTKIYQDIKKNIFDILQSNEELFSNKTKRNKCYSEPKEKYERLNFKKKFFDKKVSLNTAQKDNFQKLNINKERQRMRDLEQLKINNLYNKENEKDENIDNELDLKHIASKDSLDENIIKDKILNLDKYISNNTSSPKNNNSINIGSSNCLNSDNNLEFNVYNNNNQEEIYSAKSSEKFGKLNKKYNLKSNLSSSSFSKNFLLKSEVCKSSALNENRHYYKNNRSQGNPIINYFNQDLNHEKNIKKIYLFATNKSIEEIDQNNYMNSFHFDEESKRKSEYLKSCNCVKKKEVPGEIITEIFNNNNENEHKDFNFSEFQKGKSDESIHILELINKNLNQSNKENKDNKPNEETKIEQAEIKINENKEENEKEDEEGKEENQDNNLIEMKTANIVSESLNNLVMNNNNNTNYPENKNINININTQEKNNEQLPLSLINNIYYINNNNYQQYQFNPIYYNKNLKDMNQYNYLNNKPNNQENTDYFKTLMLENDYEKTINFKLKNNLNNNYLPNNSFFNNKAFNENMIMNNINNNINNNLNNNLNARMPISLNNNNNFNYQKPLEYNSYNANNININNNNQMLLNKNYFEYSNEEILNRAQMLIKEQQGCRFLQEKIKSDNNFANELLFQKIKNDFKELSCNEFGNYFLQAFIEILSFDNINKFLDIIQNDFTEICISPHGTRVIQKLIDKISSTPILLNKFIYNVNNKDLGFICKSPYGNHIIQKFLISNTSEYSNFIYNYVYKNFLDITNSKHGVCVIQKCVSEGDEVHRDKIYKLILQNFDSIMKDQFGNYLIQYILINTRTEDKLNELLPLINKISENIIDLCKYKNSANVIEKCLENTLNLPRENLIKALLQNTSDKLVEVLLDKFGIYVIQKALKFLSVNYKNRLIELIQEKRKDLANINLNDPKYKVIQKVINLNKEIGKLFFNKEPTYFSEKDEHIFEENNNRNYNNYNNHNYYNNNNRRGKNKRGRKNYRDNPGNF